MSLTAILNSAVTGLNSSQAALLTTATNIANINTPGFAREKVEFETLVVNGDTAGVQISDIRRVVDEFLLSELRSTISDEKMFATSDVFHARLQALFGTPDENSSLSGKVDAIFEGMGNLPVDPSSVARRVGVLNDLKVFAETVSRLSEQVQTLRKDANFRVGIAVTTANEAIQEIAELNPLIATGIITGDTPNGLLERRDQAVRSLSEILDISTRVDNNGFLIVGTRNGLPLITPDSYFQLDYTTEGTVTSSSRFLQIEAKRYDPVNKILDPIGIAVDHELQSGELRALLDMRDTTLPNIAFELGELAAKMMDQLNRVHNENTTIPAPQIMTGRDTGLLGSDAHGFTGTAVVAIHNADGTVFQNVSIDFDTIGGTVNNMVTAMNTALNPVAGVSFVDGVMTVQAFTPGRSIAVVQDPLIPSDRGGRGFAHFFGLNDLMTADSPAHFDTGLVGTDQHGFTAGQNITLQLLSPSNEVAVEHVEIIAGSTFNDILTSLNAPGALGNFGTFSLDINGALVFTPQPGFKNYRIDVVSDSTLRGGTGVSMGSLFGLGDSIKMDRAKDVKVIDDIYDNPGNLALYRVDLSALPGEKALAPGDPTGALAFQSLQNDKFSFAAAGGLGPVVAELAEYGATILGETALLANRTQQRLISATTLREEIEKRSNEVSGVNLDEELSRMIVYQNAYNASARLIATAQDMLDTLLSVIR